MKIMHIISARQLRGAEVFALQLAQCYEARGHEVLMVALYTYDTPKLDTGKIRYLELNCRKKSLPFHAASRLNDAIKQFAPDIVQANAGDTLKFAIISRMIYRWSCPIVFRNASMVSLYLKNPLARAFNGWLYANVDAVASVTEATMRDLISLFPTVRNKISAIPIGVIPREIPVVLRNGLQIIHIGGFSFEKNHAGLLRIFSRVREVIPEARLMLIGDGPLRPSVEQQVRELNLSGSVEFTGAIPDPASHLLASAVLVLPSIIEGLPGVILEAFYYKTPVVAYDVGGIGDVVKDNVTGRLIPQGDEEAFAQAVCEVLKPVTALDAMIESAHRKVVDNYNVEKGAETFLALYAKLPSKRKQ